MLKHLKQRLEATTDELNQGAAERIATVARAKALAADCARKEQQARLVLDARTCLRTNALAHKRTRARRCSLRVRLSSIRPRGRLRLSPTAWNEPRTLSETSSWAVGNRA